MEDSYMCLLPQNEKDFSDSTNYLLKEIESIPTEEEIAKRKIELEKDIRKYFVENPYPGYDNGFEINIINFPREWGDVEVFPKDIDEELDGADDFRWEKGLNKLGEKYGFTVRIPPYCYQK